MTLVGEDGKEKSPPQLQILTCLRIKSLCFELLDSATGVVRPEVICLNQGIQQLDFVMPRTVLSTCLALCGAAWH